MSQRFEKMSRAEIRRIERKGPLAQARVHLYRMHRENRILTITNLLTLFLLVSIAVVLIVELTR